MAGCKRKIDALEITEESNKRIKLDLEREVAPQEVIEPEAWLSCVMPCEMMPRDRDNEDPFRPKCNCSECEQCDMCSPEDGDNASQSESQCDCNCYDCDECKDRKEAIAMAKEERQYDYIREWELGGCPECGCRHAFWCTIGDDMCDCCMTNSGQTHYDYKVRLLTKEELALRPYLEPIESVMKMSLEEYDNKNMLHEIRSYIHIELSDTVGGEPADD